LRHPPTSGNDQGRSSTGTAFEDPCRQSITNQEVTSSLDQQAGCLMRLSAFPREGSRVAELADGFVALEVLSPATAVFGAQVNLAIDSFVHYNT